MGLHESRRYKAIFQALIGILLLPSANGEIQFAQEDPGLFAVDLPEYPILPTDSPGGTGPELMLPGLAKASALVVDLFMGSEADHDLFLSDDYWPVSLGNNTTTNLTA